MENELLMSLLPTWHSLSPAIEIHAPEISGPDGADQFPGCFLTPFWEKSAESSGGLLFDSAISSLASSHVSLPNTSTDGFLIRELIGKLGNSGELSPQSSKSDHLYEENDATLRHSTSPMHPGLPSLSPAATRLSSHTAQSFNGCSGRFAKLAAMGKVMSRVSSSPALKPVGSLIPNQESQDQAELSNSPEESSVYDPEKEPGPENWRKRKAATKGKEAGVEGGPGSKRAKRSDGGSGHGSAHAKAEDEARGGGGGDGEDEKLQVKGPPEPPRDYVHVRARRGEATDSHSLAERVRREKISERMKILQDLVPGCNKVTGKALMLDDIINYVQSLQRQVEFLSMKLASFTAGTDIGTNDPTAKDVLQSESSVPSPSQMLPLGSFSDLYGRKATTQRHSMDPSNDEQSLLYQAFLGDDLQGIVQMGFGQN